MGTEWGYPPVMTERGDSPKRDIDWTRHWGSPPERTWDQWIEVLWDEDGVPLSVPPTPGGVNRQTPVKTEPASFVRNEGGKYPVGQQRNLGSSISSVTFLSVLEVRKYLRRLHEECKLPPDLENGRLQLLCKIDDFYRDHFDKLGKEDGM